METLRSSVASSHAAHQRPPKPNSFRGSWLNLLPVSTDFASYKGSRSQLRPEITMSFGLYALGYLILIIGVAYLAHLMHIPDHYIIAVAIILFGIGVVTGVQATRTKDPN
jgi:hypothetical protein